MGKGRKRPGFHPWEIEVLYLVFLVLAKIYFFVIFAGMITSVCSTLYWITYSIVMYYLTCLWRH